MFTTMKGTGTVVPVHAMRGRVGIPPLILNLSIRREGVVNITPQPPYSRERIPVPIE
jgi:hypothetical protein